MITPLDIQEYTLAQCQEALELLDQQYDFDQTLTGETYTQAIDHVVNCILWIEDRQRELMYLANGEKGAESRNKQAENRALGIAYTAIMTPKGRADSVKEAAALTGYTQSTIRTYLVNRREEYYRCP
jgi:hypothetical protein